MNYFIKFCFDRIFAFIGLLLLSPLFLFIAIAIICQSKRPVLFKQKRVGRFGKVFTIYKFRTMTINPGFNTISVKGDPRITKIG
ncbi:MAG: sugar transferase, partial [Bacteroidia bacterium]|nr:sugar transferase [Bacteroidia bacterium]